MEPPVSSPNEMAQREAAMAAPEPLLDPPASRRRFHGFRTISTVLVSVAHAGSELRHVQLAQKYGPGALGPGDDRRVFNRYVVLA